MRKPEFTFATCRPCSTTSRGRRGSASATRFCVCTAAMSGSVPVSNTSVMLPPPFERRRREIHQVVDAGELLLDDLDDRALDGVRVGAGIRGVDRHLRRRDVRIGLGRQRADGEHAAQRDEDRDHPREYRAVDEELRPWLVLACGGCGGGRRFSG